MSATTPETMIAAWYEAFGPARDVLNVGQLPTPQPGPGEVLVRLGASGLNPHDVKKRSGWMGGTLQTAKVIPHGDGAGIIWAVGDGVANDLLGKRVWIFGGSYAHAGAGTSAEFVAVPATQALALPDTMSFEQGACLGVPAFTAYYALLVDGPVTGQDILVQGGAGAVGSVAIELARWNGARVTATVSSDEKAEVARAAGADEIVNYNTEDTVARIMEITNGRGVDRIVEVDFGANIAINAAVLTSNGTLASYSSTRVREPVFAYYDFAMKGCRLHLVQAMTMPNAVRVEAARVIMALLSRDMLKPRIAHTFALDDIADAHELLESGTAIGNIVVTLPD
ncbi:MAG: NADPH:quinone reductase [Hyphomicrobiaceae bacterium]